MAPIDVREEARTEIHEAFAWYEEKQAGLGFQFLVSLDAVIARIRRHPSAFPVVEGHVRRAVLRRFPYTAIFEYDGGRVVLLAVYHGRRRPLGWTDRLAEPVAALYYGR